LAVFELAEHFLSSGFELIPLVSIQGRAMSIQKVSIRQVKAARALLGWSQSQLSYRAMVSVPTIKRLEANADEFGGRVRTRTKIIETLEAAGVEFIEENGGGVGVRLKRKEDKS
jgi:ribosome-binding protein aMBF1 (putative translation factor)